MQREIRLFGQCAISESCQKMKILLFNDTHCLYEERKSLKLILLARRGKHYDFG